MDEATIRSSLAATREARSRTFAVQEKLLSSAVTEDELRRSADFLSPVNYDDVVTERAASRLCGYPLCCDAVSLSPPKYQISLSERRVYRGADSTLRFCSPWCRKASRHYKSQLSSTARGLRSADEQRALDNIRVVSMAGFSVTSAAEPRPAAACPPPAPSVATVTAMVRDMVVEREVASQPPPDTARVQQSTSAVEGYAAQVTSPRDAEAQCAAELQAELEAALEEEMEESDCSVDGEPLFDLSTVKDDIAAMTMSPFMTLWDVLTQWCTQYTRRQLRSASPVVAPETAPSSAWSSRQNFMRRQLCTTFARLQSEGHPLVSSMNRSTVDRELGLLVWTFDLDRSIPSLSASKWRVVVLVLLAAAMVGRGGKVEEAVASFGQVANAARTSAASGLLAEGEFRVLVDALLVEDQS